MTRTFILILLFPLLSHSQGDRYRFQMSLGLHSILNYGTKSFDHVSRSTSLAAISYYEKEWYNIDYKNFTLSTGFTFGLSVNWVNQTNFIIRQNSTAFIEVYKEEIEFTLAGFEVGDTASYPNTFFDHDFDLGYEGMAVINGLGFGVTQELMYLRKVGKSVAVGGGLTFTFRQRNDQLNCGICKPYIPNDRALSYGQYNTAQLGISAQFEKMMDRWSIFLNLNQAFLTAKKEKNKGASYFASGEKLNPISHNLDFRFPLTIQFGAAIQFDRIK